VDSYDVIIIGTGAGGGTLARRLAPSGKRILLLERGDWLTREPENWDTHDVFVGGRYISPDTWYGDDGKGFQPQVHYFVGGATKLYGGPIETALAPHFSLEEIAKHAVDFWLSIAGVAHQSGTCRFGNDPADSALDANCKAHGLDNLYVVDTSFMPSISAVNPALTAMANALRVGDHLLGRLGTAA
jgi:choline dehydrogenase-like flavoprotein